MYDHGFLRREQHGDLRDLIGRPHETRATVTVGPGDVITTAHNRLRNAGFSQLPVLEDGNLAGVISEEAIIGYAYGETGRMNDSVANAMQTEFKTIDKDTDVDELVTELHSHPCVAVMDGDGEEFLGLITRADVLNYMRKQL